jgi:hypothetical protein
MRVLADVALIAGIIGGASIPVMLVCGFLVDCILIDRHRCLTGQELIEPVPLFDPRVPLTSLIVGTSLIAPRLVSGYKVTIALAPSHWRMVTIVGAVSIWIFLFAFLLVALIVLLLAVLAADVSSVVLAMGLGLPFVWILCGILVDWILVPRHRRLTGQELVEPPQPSLMTATAAGTGLLAPRLTRRAGLKVTIALAPGLWRTVTIVSAISAWTFMFASLLYAVSKLLETIAG